jgi:hypothetical protein
MSISGKRQNKAKNGSELPYIVEGKSRGGASKIQLFLMPKMS